MNHILFTVESGSNNLAPISSSGAMPNGILTTKSEHIFNYVDAPAGAGKTKWAIQWSKKQNTKFVNVLFVVPTIKLANEYKERSNGEFHVIHTESEDLDIDSGKVIERIRQFFLDQDQYQAKARTLVITQEAFLSIHFLKWKSNWYVIIDEASEPLKMHNIRCPKSKNIIKELFEFTDGSSNFSELKRISKVYGATSYNRADDDIGKSLVHLENCLKNSFLEVLGDKEKLEKTNAELVYSVFIKPKIYHRFKSICFMSANFCDSFLYHMYKYNGVLWEKLENNLTSVIDSSRVRIHYCFDDKSWSKYFREFKTSNNGQSDEISVSNLDILLDWFLSKESGKDYIYVANTSVDFKSKIKGERIPAVSHGLNTWRDCTKIFVCGSYLINQTYNKFYLNYGCSTADARGLRNNQMIYQQIMRTNLRVANSTLPIDVYVPTIAEALELLGYLPNASICDCFKDIFGLSSGIVGKLKQEWIDDNSEPIELSRSNNEDIVFGLHLKQLNTMTCDFQFENYDLGDEETISIETYSDENFESYNLYDKEPKLNCTESSLSIKKNKGRPKSIGHNILKFISEFNSCIDISNVKTKEGIYEAKTKVLGFFVTGQFTENVQFTKKNCIGSNRIIAFDFDNSTISPTQIRKVFRGNEILIYETPSNKFSDIGRRHLRAIVLCSRTMTLGEHKKIMKYFVNELNQVTEDAKVDMSKLTPYGKFLMPHKDSVVKNQNKYDQKPLDIDNILKKIPDKKVKSPSLNDLYFDCPQGISSGPICMPAVVQNIISGMKAGDRSSKAVSVAGKCSHLPYDLKHIIFDQLDAQGIDKSAKKSCKKYMQL